MVHLVTTGNHSNTNVYVMILNKYGVFHLFFLFVISSLHAQKIILIENQYLCRGCDFVRPRIEKDDIKSMIATEDSLSRAANKIRKYFVLDGDRFMLFCPSCETTPRTIGFKQNHYPSPNKSLKGFGMYLGIEKTGSNKGGEEFYTFNDVLQLLTDSILIIDQLEIPTATIANTTPAVLASLQASYKTGDSIVTRRIPYDETRQMIRLTYADLFGNRQSRDSTDGLLVTLQYVNSFNEKVAVPGTLKVFFASKEEKNDLVDWYAVYRKTFPAWTKEDIADELCFKVICKYNNALRSNLIQWLKKQP